MTKTCAVCPTEFEPGSNRARYCSDACRTAARRARTGERTPRPFGNRRDGFNVVIDGVPGVWRPKYLTEDQNRLPTANPEDLRTMPGRFDPSKSRGQVDRKGKALARDAARQWALNEFGVDIGPDM